MAKWYWLPKMQKRHKSPCEKCTLQCFLYFVFILVVINTSLQNPTQYLSLQVNSICKLITKLCCTWMLLHLTGSRTHVYWMSSIYFNFHLCFICSPANMLNLTTNKTISINAFLKYFFRNFFYFVTKQVKLICIFNFLINYAFHQKE